MRNFEELKIWQKGIDVAVKNFHLTETLPKGDKYGLAQQMNRCGVSIPSNIAEGSSRRSEKDYARFIEISIGSAVELETQLLIAERLKKGDQQLLADFKKRNYRSTAYADGVSIKAESLTQACGIQHAACSQIINYVLPNIAYDSREWNAHHHHQSPG